MFLVGLLPYRRMRSIPWICSTSNVHIMYSIHNSNLNDDKGNDYDNLCRTADVSAHIGVTQRFSVSDKIVFTIILRSTKYMYPQSERNPLDFRWYRWYQTHFIYSCTPYNKSYVFFDNVMRLAVLWTVDAILHFRTHFRLLVVSIYSFELRIHEGERLWAAEEVY